MELDPHQQKEFANQVVRRLVEQGFIAYWAGGCVRDSLLGRVPKDYDVATNALPEQVRDLFGHRRTHAVGAAFGVITVAGQRGAGHVEVATFRRDADYSDGRHPDAVEFSTPQEDASRRDFTINGLFYDPLADQVIDLVDGRADLQHRIVRAIGDPHARITEDKLRMLRAVRFAATFDFQLEPATRAAISQLADQLPVVSAERIAQEMRLTLALPRGSQALRLLDEIGLLKVLLPEVAPLAARDPRLLDVLTRLERPSFSLALATILAIALPEPAELAVEAARQVGKRWKLSNKEQQRILWLVQHRDALRGAEQQFWPTLQRVLIEPGIHELLDFHQARAAVANAGASDVDFCRARLAWPAERLNPPPLVSGHDLIRHGLTAGASFQSILDRIRDAQLQGQIATPEEALALAVTLAGNHKPVRDN